MIPTYQILDNDHGNWIQGQEHDLQVKRLSPTTLDEPFVLNITCDGGEVTEGEKLTDNGSENWSADIKILPITDKVKIGINSKNGNVELNEDFEQEEIKELNTNGYEYVDMGEAGIWAKYNFGTEDVGKEPLYFRWGETKGYAAEEIKNKKYNDFPNISYVEEKYINPGQNKVLEPEDDAASVNMGGDWRMPTREECQKLLDLCSIENVGRIEAEDGSSVLNCITLSLKTNKNKQLVFPYNKTGFSLGGADYYPHACVLTWTSTPDGVEKAPESAWCMFANPLPDVLSEVDTSNYADFLPVRAILDTEK